MYTPYKQKHNLNNHSGRGRDRPKKEQTDSSIEKNKYDPLTNAYFQKEERTRNTQIENINEFIKNAFNYLYINENGVENAKEKLKVRKMKEYKKWKIILF